MGKSKKRIFNKNIDIKGTVLTRNEAVKNILNNLKSRNNKQETEKLINLFGITAEELLEAGANYEEVSAIKNLFL